MKLLKQLTLGLFLTISSVAIVPAVFAASGDTYPAAHSIKQVEIKIIEAQDAIITSKNKESVTDDEKKAIRSLILKAKKWSGEINATNIDRDREKANKHLTKARSAVKNDDFTAAEDHLKKALALFQTFEARL